MENLSHNLIKHVPVAKRAIVLRRSQRNLVWFVPYALAASLAMGRRERFDLVHVGDVFLAPLGVLLKRALGVPVVVTAHGLDVTWNPRPYQAVIRPALRAMDRVICISRATLEECVRRGVPSEKCVFVPPGIEVEQYKPESDLLMARKRLTAATSLNIDGKRLLLTAGRLVPRKGHQWFLRNVLPHLDSDVIYAIAGDGPEKKAIEEAAIELGLKERVLLLGQLPVTQLRALMEAADVFVMPNIPIEGDMEGFGIVALEAAASGAVVVASGIEGITDAVIHGENGWLVGSLDAPRMVDQIRANLEDPVSAREFARQARSVTLEKFSWERVAQSYLREFRSLTNGKDLAVGTASS